MSRPLVALLLLALALCAVSSASARTGHKFEALDLELEERTAVSESVRFASLDPDTHRNVTQLIESKGYPCINYQVRAPDGYLLSVQRIPYGRAGPTPGKRPVVWLQHGVTDASTTWVINFASNSLAFILADAGYDVWLGNDRGNTYSKALNTLSDAYWDFTWDDLGLIDLPAALDFALQTSGADRFHAYVGHSQGTTQGFALFTQRPEYAAKVGVFVALAPVAYYAHPGSLLFEALAALRTDQILSLLGVDEFLPSSQLLETLLPEVCKLTPWVCEETLCIVAGCQKQFMNMSRWDVYVGHYPSGTSVMNMAHWAQLIRSNKFQKFDFGSASANQAHYGQDTPPLYKLADMATKVALFYGSADTLGDPKDVETAIHEIPSNKLVYKEEFDGWGHMTFIWDNVASQQVYPKVLSLISQHGPAGQ